MEKDLITKLNKQFEDYVHIDENGVEFWYARELQFLLDYVKWDTFKNVVQKAKEACQNSGYNIDDHFSDVGKMVEIGSGAIKEVNDYKLTRYACYLIAQNGDPRKEVIAFAQTYFAVQTRKQEIIEKRILEWERINARHKLSESDKNLSKVIYEKGVDSKGFARIKSKGDEALFGKSTKELKKDFGIKDNKPLADVLPTITIKAKDFANAKKHFDYNSLKDAISIVESFSSILQNPNSYCKIFKNGKEVDVKTNEDYQQFADRIAQLKLIAVINKDILQPGYSFEDKYTETNANIKRDDGAKKCIAFLDTRKQNASKNIDAIFPPNALSRSDRKTLDKKVEVFNSYKSFGVWDEITNCAAGKKKNQK